MLGVLCAERRRIFLLLGAGKDMCGNFFKRPCCFRPGMNTNYSYDMNSLHLETDWLHGTSQPI